MLDNSETQLPSDPRYGVVINLEENNKKIEDNSLRRISLYQHGAEVLHFHNFAWQTKTIKEILEKSGFSQIAFKEATVSPDGIKKYGEEFWNEYKKHPGQVVFSATK